MSKPTVENLGIDLSAQRWQRSGTGNGTIEVAMVAAPDGDQEWILMRVAGDAAGRVLVYDRHEWECFLDGVRGGEFDAAILDTAPAVFAETAFTETAPAGGATRDKADTEGDSEPGRDQ
jgi:hypothetical protein